MLRWERASGATDVHALGVIAYEMLAGARPFAGPDFREQHLQEVPATLRDVSRPLAALVAECLRKGPGARPSASDVARRLASAGGGPKSPGLARLQQAHHDEISQRAAAQGQASLWYCDAGEEGHFSWYEMAFMDNPLTGGGRNVKALRAHARPAGIAFSQAIGTKQLARSLRRLVPGELDDFIARWGDWLAAACDATLTSPSRMPEEDIEKNCRGAR